MKKKILFLSFLLLPVFMFAQFTTKKDAALPKTDTIANTVDLKLQLHSDTARARIIVFAKGESDQFLSWLEGYVIVKTYKFPNGQVAGTVGNLAYTLKWELIKPEGIFDIKVIETKDATNTNNSSGNSLKKKE